MNYHISKLADFNPALSTELKNHCYAIIGLCKSVLLGTKLEEQHVRSKTSSIMSGVFYCFCFN